MYKTGTIYVNAQNKALLYNFPMTKLILASASLGRKYLLDKLKLDYETIHTDLDEEKIIADNPINTIKLRAKMKGESAAGLLASSHESLKSLKFLKEKREYLILSADTEVILDGKLFGKPSSEKEAVKMLKLLSGKIHEVVTAVYISKLLKLSKSLKSLKRSENIYDSSRVTFRKLTDSDIKRYLKYTDYTRYTGGYALVASPQDFVTKVEGSISNVIGLPMEKVIPVLEKYFTL